MYRKVQEVAVILHPERESPASVINLPGFNDNTFHDATGARGTLHSSGQPSPRRVISRTTQRAPASQPYMVIAVNPPSTNRTVPVTKEDALSEAR